ncbi:MAG TPA: hypothetical protein VND68_06985, partial [Chloroflexia bacterium]|nr:hypothetical protein [Chloroflexia bacterium]
WPFRDPHNLTQEMHEVQRGMSRFVAGTWACGFDWLNFSPQPIDEGMQVTSRTPGAAGEVPLLPFGCSDGTHSLIWLLRDKRVAEHDAPIAPADLLVPSPHESTYIAEFWETYSGERLGEYHLEVTNSPSIHLPLPAFGTDIAITLRPANSVPLEANYQE